MCAWLMKTWRPKKRSGGRDALPKNGAKRICRPGGHRLLPHAITGEGGIVADGGRRDPWPLLLLSRSDPAARRLDQSKLALELSQKVALLLCTRTRRKTSLSLRL